MKYIMMLCALIVLTSCSKGDKESGVKVGLRGQWKSERVYENKFFDLALEIPEGWEIDKGNNKEMAERASEFLAGDDKNLKDTMASAIEQTYTVCNVRQYPLGTPGKTNPNFSVIIENVGQFPGITTAEEYLVAVEDTLKMSQKEIRFVGGPEKAKLGGVEFTMRRLEIPMGTMTIKQKVNCLFKDGYAILLTTTTLTPQDEITLSVVTDGVRHAEE